MRPRRRDPRPCRHNRHLARSAHDFTAGVWVGHLCLRCGRFRPLGMQRWQKQHPARTLDAFRRRLGVEMERAGFAVNRLGASSARAAEAFRGFVLIARDAGLVAT